MKVREIVEGLEQQPVVVLPSLVRRQARVAGVVKQIAASDAQRKPSEMDMVLAMRRYSDLKKQTNRNYAQLLRKQLAAAESM